MIAALYDALRHPIRFACECALGAAAFLIGLALLNIWGPIVHDWMVGR